MFEGTSFRRLVATAAVTAAMIQARSAFAQTVSAPGFIYSFQTLSDTTQACVAAAPGGTFVGQGPGFTGNAESVAFVSESGDERTVVTGFNAIGDCAYDVVTDVLYVVDNALEAPGSVTGDTAYAIPGALTAEDLTASGFNLKPSGSIPNAFSVALDSAGNVYVSDATGGGAGTVRKIALSNGALTTFASGFDLTGGIIWDAAGDLFVAETLTNGDSQISRYNASGVFQEIVSGPTDEHGSFDLALNADGRLLATGLFAGEVTAVDPSTGDVDPVADGFTFATSVDVDDFTGRIGLVSSTFIGLEEDFRLHQLTSVSSLAPDGGANKLATDRHECVSEFYGVELAISTKGRVLKKAICHDGALCDADGRMNGQCLFPLGVCLNVADPRIPKCSSDSVSAFALKKPKAGVSVPSTLADSVADALPVDGAQCFFSDGVIVPLRLTKHGVKAGKLPVKVKVQGDSPVEQADVDSVKLVCEPS
jgi:hypothetical protein